MRHRNTNGRFPVGRQQRTSVILDFVRHRLASKGCSIAALNDHSFCWVRPEAAVRVATVAALRPSLRCSFPKAATGSSCSNFVASWSALRAHFCRWHLPPIGGSIDPRGTVGRCPAARAAPCVLVFLQGCPCNSVPSCRRVSLTACPRNRQHAKDCSSSLRQLG